MGEIAEAALYLASESVRSINGHTLMIDGGWLTRGYPALLTGVTNHAKMMIDARRYTSGRIAVANLSTSIASLERCRVEGPTFANLVALSNLLFVHGDVLGRIADHDRAQLVALQAIALSPDTGTALYTRARLAGRFHRFDEAHALLRRACTAGYASLQIDGERAALLQATGQYPEAMVLRERLAKNNPGIHTLGALASLLAEMDQWDAAESCYAAALDADDGVSPFPCGQLLFEWGLNAMRRDLDRTEELFAELNRLLPQHVPARGHRAQVALGRGQVDLAAALIEPLLTISDDPEYRAIAAQILVARGDCQAVGEAECAAAAYERLLARQPEAYADHAAAFFIGIGNRPQLGVDLAWANWKRRDTAHSRDLLDKALRNARQAAFTNGEPT
jgi:tetratricopeptide (TPR) repeat protein